MKTKQTTTDRTVPKSKRTNRGGWRQCAWEIEAKSISLAQNNEHVLLYLGIQVFL